MKELLDENRSIRQQISDLSNTSTSYEEMLRRKESELSVLRNDAKKHAEDKKQLDIEKSSLSTRHDNMQNRLRELQAQADAMKSEKAQLEREAADVRNLLQAKMWRGVQRMVRRTSMKERKWEKERIKSEGLRVIITAHFHSWHNILYRQEWHV